MYVPKPFALDDETALRVIRENGFATLVTADLDAVHLPILVSQDSPLILTGHVAKANPIWRTFTGDQEQLIIFHGPHAYVSPGHYVGSPNVPTWNYVTVHAKGRARAVEDPARAVRLLQELSRFYDPSLPETLPEGLADEYVASRVGGIVAFEMVVERLEGKAKLSQNRGLEDQRRVKEALTRSDDQASRLTAEWMLPGE